jgi:hypothetical protein
MKNFLKKHDYEILFKDSPEYFAVLNAKMMQEGSLIRFICFVDDKLSHEEWYPIQNIHRIKRYAEKVISK